MNEDIEEINYPLADPAWDYYSAWSKLQQAKEFIYEATGHLQECEFSDDNSDDILHAFVRNAIKALEEILA